MGIGTYLGESDATTDQRYTDAALHAISNGVNVLDSAINYRFQRSERNIGAAVKQLHGQREELLICTKAGYLTYDSTVPADPRRYFIEQYIDTGIVPREELVGGMRCMAPNFLRNQLERSRHNLDVETIDVFYIHNPEQQLGEVSRDIFHDRLRRAFAALEKEVTANKIRVYGTATWSGYRQERGAKDYLDLAQIAAIAREVGGEGHHFRAIQLPFNLGLPEAFAKNNQRVEQNQVSLLTAARQLGIAVVASASLLQGKLAGRLPEFVRERMKCETDAESAIQFSRSAPGVTSALVGMSRKEHVDANLKVAAKPMAREEDWESLFQKQQ
ncbi:MAG TPA: aldo/keto reductase [Candidatus Dormibacteraeota bacterium]|nr:aldo/keto reductase [Candidatus Dormibacteraeota bacterium]